MPSDDAATLNGTTPLIGIDGSRSIFVAETDKITRATVGITAQHRNGFFIGAGVSWNVPSQGRDLRFAEDGKDVPSDYFDWQVRIGYHPGVRVYVAAAAAAAAAATTARRRHRRTP